MQSGQTAAAVNAFQEGHQTDPADVEILNNLGHACLMQGDLASAERYLLSVLTLVPERTPTWSDLGQVYAKRGDTRNAVASFANAYQFSQNREKTHQFFLGLMEKQQDVNLRQALRQATQVGERKFLSAGANLDIKSKNLRRAQDVQTNQEVQSRAQRGADAKRRYEQVQADAQRRYEQAQVEAQRRHQQALVNALGNSRKLTSAQNSYERALASAQNSYERALASARNSYERTRSSVQNRYERALMSARNSYERAQP